MQTQLLVIDDEPKDARLLKAFFEKNEYNVACEQTGRRGLAWLKTHKCDLVLCDFALSDCGGIDLIDRIKSISDSLPIIVLTELTEVSLVVKALKHGVNDYITKPFKTNQVLSIVEQVLVRKKDKKVKSVAKDDFLQASSDTAKALSNQIKLVAPTDYSVIVTGETGTGKEYAARQIHTSSNRSNMPFIPIDCGVLTENLAASELFGHEKGAFTGATENKKGAFEQANGGTLFLDEIGNLSYENQVILLRALQEKAIRPVGSMTSKKIDLRIIVATNEDLIQDVQDGNFREDLYHRLNEFKITLSPLRERKEDIIAFAQHFLKKSNDYLNKNIIGFDDQTRLFLTECPWSGNLRELQNVIKRSALFCDKDFIGIEHLPDEILNPPNTSIGLKLSIGTTPISLKSIAQMAEKEAILEVLDLTGYNKTKTAQFLKIDRKTLYNKLDQYDINTF